MFVFKAAVVGAGTMGGEIAQVLASAGIPVLLKDVDQDLVDQGLAKARQVTERQVGADVKKGKLSEKDGEGRVEETVGRITGTLEYEGFGEVDFVVEAVPERMDVKHTVFGELDLATPRHTILASNTSSLSITEIAKGTTRPENVVGFHFFYPASMMRLIEVIAGERTSRRTVRVATSFAQEIRKQPVRCADQTGFVVNRVLQASLSEIWRSHDEDDLQVEGIDGAVSTAGAAPMPPYYLSDMLGLDTVLHVAENLQETFGERFYISPEVRELVEEGNLGQKTGKGFYEHGS